MMLKVQERKLGRHKAHGLCHPNNLIEIDPRQSERDRLDTILHEALHAIPETKQYSEDWVISVAAKLQRLLWQQGYRRIHQ